MKIKLEGSNMVRSKISAIEYYLPEAILTNEMLADDFDDWDVKKIFDKVGIEKRHIAGENECASDLGVFAAQKLFASRGVAPEEIDCLLFCTQCPDYFLPTTACLMQDRLGMRTSSLALDFNLGCSGYVYGLGLAKGLIETGQVRNVLLITGDTYSKLIGKNDRSVRTLFGDGAAATLLEAEEGDVDRIGPFIYGTDGAGGKNLIVPAGGMRRARDSETATQETDGHGNVRSLDNLYMNGSEILNFTLRRVPEVVKALHLEAGVEHGHLDLYVFHQANRFMLDLLQKKCCIAEDKFVVACKDVGNTVSSTIPIALKVAQEQGRLAESMRVMLVGFGVGYSWAGTLIRW